MNKYKSKADRLSRGLMTALIALLGTAFHVHAAADDYGGSSAAVLDGSGYLVSAIRIEYVHAFAELPSPDELAAFPVELGLVDDGYVAPRDDLSTVEVTLGEIGRVRQTRIYESAARHIAAELAAELSNRFGAAFFVALDDRDIDPETGADLRPPARRALRYRIEYTGPQHEIDGFHLLYIHDVQGQPTLESLMRTRVELTPTKTHGFVAWRPGVTPEVLTLDEIASRGTERYSAAGIQQVLLAVRDALLEHKLMAIRVVPSEEDLARSMREPATVSLVIVTGLASEIRTLASGERIAPGPERINHPKHARILERSPVQPGVPGKQLLNRDALDEYIFLIGRHPGRRVDVAIAPGEEELTVNLDYIVTENKPWLIYLQGSNTGTPQTSRWRQRIGFFHNQLTNNDDILSLDYVTAEFDSVHGFTGSYEARFFDSDRLRWRVMGTYSEFDASEVGFPEFRFTGESYSVGGELVANVYQERQFFLDLVGGVRYLNIEIENLFLDQLALRGQEDFLLPYGGVRMERVTEKAMTRGSLIFEGNIASITAVDPVEINRLGRPDPDRDWITMQWDLAHSFFLEPVLNPEGWADVATPETSTLAHELAVNLRGQYAFGNRLIPQVSSTAGGMFTVRGYPESVVAGDTVIISNIEYRFHVPRGFDVREPEELFGQPFRWAPQHLYGRADWDLTLRAFLDVGHVINHDRRPLERNETLLGTGIGVEFQFKRLLNLRLDWGVALKGVDDRVRSGSNRAHFIGTLLF